MLLYFDESGDFAYPDDRFDAYTQAVLICADSKLANIEEYLEGRKAAWGVEELHATELDDARVFDVSPIRSAPSGCRYWPKQRTRMG